MSDETWSGRRALVTGATGIIGAWLTRDLLDRGVDVTVLVQDDDRHSELFRSGDIERTRVISGRLESLRDLERAIVEGGADTVFHLGAQAIVGRALEAPWLTFEANVRGTYNLLEACRRHSGIVQRVVVASSDKAYGSSDVLPYTEDMPPLGRHPYDVSKSCTDLISTSYAETYDLPIAIARCGNVYGGGDLHWNRLVPGTIRAVLEGRSPEIRSDGTFTRDYIHVDDVVSAYVQLAEHLTSGQSRGEAFNFAPGEPVSVTDMVATIIDVMGADVQPRILDTAQGEIRDQYLDAGKARDVLGWKPAVDLRTGLTRTVDWYRSNLQHA